MKQAAITSIFMHGMAVIGLVVMTQQGRENHNSLAHVNLADITLVWIEPKKETAPPAPEKSFAARPTTQDIEKPHTAMSTPAELANALILPGTSFTASDIQTGEDRPAIAAIPYEGSLERPSASASQGPKLLSSNPKPDYPREARRRGWQGEAVVRASVNPGGESEAVILLASSGYGLLDDAALSAVRRWRFSPARKNGEPVAASIDLPVRFTLTP